MLNIVHEFTRETLAVEVAHCIDFDVVATVQWLLASRGALARLCMDNGPEITVAVRWDWCRIGGAHTDCIELGSPWETFFVEPVNGRLRDECLNS